jgi:hypothetical protein
MRQELTEHFRCPEELVDFRLANRLSVDTGYFCFGPDTMCYGRSSAGFRAKHVEGHLYDVLNDVLYRNSGAELPFDPSEVISNLRYERYMKGTGIARGAMRSAYYLFRPLMPVGVRKYLQKLRLKGWRNLNFPKWPVDTSVDNLLEKLLAVSIRCNGGERIPFIWFWPDGMPACAVMTHDVEEQAGVAACANLMDINESFGIPASFQVVPEKRYSVPPGFLGSIRTRGFEVNVHDLNHDGHLFCDHEEFKRRAAKINRYGREFGAVGFRAGALYRNPEWFESLEFEYETSVPNVAHLDPQRGGCCTVMPYFVGNILELPVTMTQDYSLFHVLNTYHLTLWEQQIDLILRKHGLINVIVHPDYLTGPREEETYKGLLGLYSRLRREQNVWIPLPREVNNWWRQRSQMRLVRRAGQWQVEGPGKERAAVAFASLEDEGLTYSILHPSGELVKQPASQFVLAPAANAESKPPVLAELR